MKDLDQEPGNKPVSFDTRAMLDKISKRIDEYELHTLHVKRMRKRVLIYTASILLPLVLISLWLFKANNQAQLKKQMIVNNRKVQDIQLVLSDGSIIKLGEQKDVKEADGKSIARVDTDGLAYTGNKDISIAVINELQVPRGRKFMLQLADGSKVWLNAESSISYPVNFTGNTREVTISGEAYFEISHDKAKPFIVHTGKATIEVLGTSFNLSSYGGEAMKTTLVEGKVKVTSERKEIEYLTPLEQAIISKAGDLSKKQVDIEPIVSWKDDLLVCKNERLEDIAKRLEREYDYHFIFNDEDVKNIHYSVNLVQNTNITTVLKYLSKAGPFTYSVNGNEIQIMKGEK